LGTTYCSTGSSAGLAEQVDQLTMKAENTKREFEKFKKQQQEEYNKLCEHIMLLSVGNSQSCCCSEHVVCLLF
jgi:hypothetical protein